MNPTSQAYVDALPLLRQGGRAAERGARLLYDCLAPQFRRYFEMHGQSPAQAEELTHDAFIKVIRQLPDVRKAGAFRGWAFAVARNTLIDEIRDRQEADDHEQSFDEAEWAAFLERKCGSGVDDVIADLCMRGQTEKFVAEHPGRAFCLERVLKDGWDIPELAAYLGRSARATSEYVSQCRQRFIAYLQYCW